MAAEVKSDCGCKWTLDNPQGWLNKLYIWRVESCNRWPSATGVTLTPSKAHEMIEKHGIDLKCHCLLP